MNGYLIFILFVLIGIQALDLFINFSNLKSFEPNLPDQFRGFYEPTKYLHARDYLRAQVQFDTVSRIIETAFLIGIILGGGFNRVDQFARGFSLGPILTGLIFIGTLGLLRLLLQIPFSAYHTFVIEERFGFNKMTPAVFAADLLKGLILSAALGAPALAGILYFFERTGNLAWLASWAALSGFQVLLTFVAPALLMPLFNRFSPLPDGELKNAIEEYARQQNFSLQGVYQMDGSRRSTKANAFFAGFGRFRRLVLFDTLVAKHSVDEAVAIVAHEVGHFRCGHIPKFMALSILSTGLIFYSLSWFIQNKSLFGAFGMEHVSIYAGLVFVSFLYSPFLKVFSLLTLAISRKFEFEADAFSRASYGKPEALATALKRLSADSLSNLTPHRLKVIFEYSHPPVLERVRKLAEQP